MEEAKARSRRRCQQSARRHWSAQRAPLEAMAHLRVVAEARDADEALRQAGAVEVDLVLMDINMRGTSGSRRRAASAGSFPRSRC
jgi:DNA-binding NarL/FixJ family response regulator